MEKEVIENLVKSVLDHLEVSCSCNIKELDGGGILINIQGESLNHLIGYRGETLKALQHFLSLAYYNKTGNYLQIVVDINDYLVKRKEKLENMARRYVDKVRFLGGELAFPPMSPSERKIIHNFVLTYPDVESFSVGEGPQRHVVLKLKEDNK